MARVGGQGRDGRDGAFLSEVKVHGAFGAQRASTPVTVA